MIDYKKYLTSTLSALGSAKCTKDFAEARIQRRDADASSASVLWNTPAIFVRRKWTWTNMRRNIICS